MSKNPFKFLASFDSSPEDRKKFFGRDAETAQLYHAIQAFNHILVYGRSGTGKTSVVDCGLHNQFDELEWLPVPIRRREGFQLSLPGRLRAALKDQDPKTTVSIPEMVARLYAAHYRPVYLIFDQLEEMYITGTRTEQMWFHGQIADLLESDLPCKVLLIIREEYLGAMADFELEVPDLFENRFRVEKMNDLTIAEVIWGMCQVVGTKIDQPEVTIPMMLHNLKIDQQRIDLTNLQVYLHHLFERRVREQPDTSVVFDPNLVGRVGKMANVLRDFLREEFVKLEGELYNKFEHGHFKGLPLEILYTMVTTDGTKQSKTTGEILSAISQDRGITRAQLQTCLTRFKEVRILES